MYVNSGEPDQTPHPVASDLDLHCLPMSHKKDTRLLWVNHRNCTFSHCMIHLHKSIADFACAAVFP